MVVADAIIGIVAIIAGLGQIAFHRCLGPVSLERFHNVLWKRQYRFEAALANWSVLVTGLGFLGFGVAALVLAFR